MPKLKTSEWYIWDIAQKSLTVAWFISGVQSTGQYIYALYTFEMDIS